MLFVLIYRSNRSVFLTFGSRNLGRYFLAAALTESRLTEEILRTNLTKKEIIIF